MMKKFYKFILFQLFLILISYIMSINISTIGSFSDILIRYISFGNIFIIIFFLQKKLLGKKFSRKLHKIIMILISYIISTALSLLILRYWFWFIFNFRFIIHCYINNLILILILGSVIMIFKYLKNELEETKEAKKRIEIDYKLKLLRSKINPHFLSNSLTAVSELAYKNNLRKLDKLIVKLSHLYRNILDFSEKNIISLNDELKTLKYYLKINKILYGENFNYSIKNSCKKENPKILPFMIQIPVENSIKHGLKGITRGKIEIEIRKQNQNLIVTVEDNGKGFSQKDFNKKGSFGLSSIEKRMNLFFDSYTFDIKNKSNKGVKVLMVIPYET